MSLINREKKDRVLSIRDLNISFETTAGRVKAIRGVRMDLFRGETIAIVGESGSGKSVTVKTIMGILAGNGRIDSGKIDYTGFPGSYDFSGSYHADWQTDYGTNPPS